MSASHGVSRPGTAFPRVLVLLLALWACPGMPLSLARVAAQDTGQLDFQPVRDHIRRVMAERHLPSVSVAVARGNRILWEESFGWADADRETPATPDTPYSLASISKPMTATGIMLLRQDGSVRLDAPFDRYMKGGGLQGLAGPAEEATVRRVLSHTAGLPLHYTFFYRNEGVPVPSPADALARYGILVFPPGERFEYSNLGYGLLGLLIRNVSGRPYAEFMEARVFRPLRMDRTSVGPRPEWNGEWARRYDPEGQPIPFYDFDHPGASAVYSSAHDLVRFGAFHLGNWIPPERGPSAGGDRATSPSRPTPGPDLLPEPVLEEMHTPQVPPDGNAYGLGWFVADEYGFRKVYHTGSMPGVSTMLALYPDQEVAIVVLLNALDREQRVEIAREAAAVVIPGYARARREEMEVDPASDRAAEDGLASALPGSWTGTLTTWEGDVPADMEVDSQGNGSLTLGDSGPLPLLSPSLEEGVFSAQVGTVMPTADALRHPEQVVVLKLVLDETGGGNGRRPTLRGQATAMTTRDPSHFALSSYLSLTRRTGGPSRN